MNAKWTKVRAIADELKKANESKNNLVIYPSLDTAILEIYTLTVRIDDESIRLYESMIHLSKYFVSRGIDAVPFVTSVCRMLKR